MDLYFVLIFCVAAGYLLRVRGMVPENTGAVLNKVILNVCLPALAVSSIHEINLDHTVLLPTLVTFVCIFLSVAFFWWAGRFSTDFTRNDKDSTGAMMLAGAFGSTTFVGVPLIVAFYGKEWAIYGALASLAGTCLALPTIGRAIAEMHSRNAGDTPVDYAKTIQDIVFSWPVVSLAVAVLARAFEIEFPHWLTHSLSLGSQSLSLLAFLSIGAALRFEDVRLSSQVFAGVTFKLVAMPLLVYLLLASLNITGTLMHVIVFCAAMPSTVTASTLCHEYSLNNKLSRQLVSVSTLASVVTLPVWAGFLKLASS